MLLAVEHGVETVGSNPRYERYLSSTGSLTIKGGLEEVSGDTLGLRASDFIDISGGAGSSSTWPATAGSSSSCAADEAGSA